MLKLEEPLHKIREFTTLGHMATAAGHAITEEEVTTLHGLPLDLEAAAADA